MSSIHAFGLHAFGSSIRAATDLADAFPLFDRYIFPSMPRVPADAVDPGLSLEVVSAPDGFELRANGSPVVAAQHPAALVLHLIHVLDEFLIGRLVTLRAAHAGVVEWNGRAILIPGSTHSGKSSLVAELLRRGARYLSDEFALIDPDGLVHPYPRPILLRAEDGDQRPALPSEFNARVPGSPVPAGAIFALRYEPGASWAVERVPQSVALLSLLRNTPHTLAATPDLAAVFERMVAQAACYEGSRGAAAEAAGKILDLVAP